MSSADVRKGEGKGAGEAEAAARLLEQVRRNPSDDINRIIIGLGGQGSRVVNEVRKEVLGKGQAPAGLEFIAIDSDRIALSNLDSVPEDQRIHLAAPDDHITETVVPWLPHEFRPKAGGGCGMQRLTGKGMYLVHRHRIMETVREVARRLRQRTQVSNFMVVVVNAFGGGTGSGMLIDFSLDVRADLKEVTGQEPVMFGIGILPSRSETIQRANGVALIKELHLLLSNKEPVVVGGRDYSSPFELFFLVGREVMGIEGDGDVLQAIVRFTIDLGLIPSTSGEHAGAGKGAGWVDLQDIRTLVKGASHMFSTFGYYRARFPGEEILEYFDAMDRIEALRGELPSLASDLDATRQALDDKKVALAHAEDVLRKARERVARLRSDGVLGSNRPELAGLLGDVARADDEVRKARREAQDAERDLPLRAKRREEIEAEIRELEGRIEALRASILAPAQSRTTYTVPLAPEELEHLTRNRRIVQEGGFRSVMEALGRLPDYHDKTMEVVGKNKVLQMPLINYRMSFHTAAAFQPRVLDALRKHGFVRFDQAGNPVVSDDHLWMIMAMLSSKPENVEANKVAGRAFKEVVEGHVARRAEVKIVPSTTKRFEVVIHSWMVGLQIAPVAPGYPPRLKELEWLMPEYEQVAREGGAAQHHAFLYGDPLAFSRLAGVAVDRTSMSRTNDLVTEFWTGYAPIDAPARWLQLPPVLAEAMVATEDIAKATSSLSEAVDEFRTGDAGMAAIDRFNMALAQGAEKVAAFGRAFAEDVNPLRDRLDALVGQLERARVGPRDPEHLLAMEELAAEALAAVGTASTLLAQLRADLPDAVRGTIGAARDDGHAAGRADRGAVRSAVRWEHVVAHAEARVSHLYQTASDSARHLESIERTLERLQEMLRARSLATLQDDLGQAPALLPAVTETGTGAGEAPRGHGEAPHGHGEDGGSHARAAPAQLHGILGTNGHGRHHDDAQEEFP